MKPSNAMGARFAALRADLAKPGGGTPDVLGKKAKPKSKKMKVWSSQGC